MTNDESETNNENETNGFVLKPKKFFLPNKYANIFSPQ